MLDKIKSDLKKLAKKEKIPIYQNFFKTSHGQYGEGDIFIGVSVPNTRKVAKKYQNVSLNVIEKLLTSKIHEERLCAFEILCFKYEKSIDEEKREIYNFCLENRKGMNNWDLVDLTAPYIIGDFLSNKNKEREILYKLAKSNNLWDKRISIISTAAFIKNNQFQDTIKISEILLKDKHDLIQKAVGWMLREVGKRDKKTLLDFLNKHYRKMPRTMLRYSIEKFPEPERKKYLKLKIEI
ncbi:MAG: DNA alkylation repair protein [Nanoarchaeota archaeon]